MRIDDATLDTAIEQHAVALGRPVWLNPEWRDLQRNIWQQFIDLHKRTPGKLIPADFAEAIRRLLNGRSAGQTSSAQPVPPKAPQAVVPPLIVDAAVEIAAARHERAKLNVEQHDDFWLVVERNRLNAAVSRARDADSAEAMNVATVEAMNRFQDEADQARADLTNSGFDEAVVNAKLAVIDQRETEAIDHINEHPPQLTLAKAAMPSLQEVHDRAFRPDRL